MSTRGFSLYRLTAQSREMHREGHSGNECPIPREDHAKWEWVDEYSPTVFDHPEFHSFSIQYHAQVATRVTESPVCPKCYTVRPVFTLIPGRTMGGGWVRGGTIVDCGYCGHRIAYKPNER